MDFSIIKKCPLSTLTKRKTTRATHVVPMLISLEYLVKKGHNSKSTAFRVMPPCLATASCNDNQENVCCSYH